MTAWQYWPDTTKFRRSRQIQNDEEQEWLVRGGIFRSAVHAQVSEPLQPLI